MGQTNDKLPSELLAAQGHQADAEQNMRLQFAGDPVYAHLATLSTASAVAGIEWVQNQKGRRGPELSAVIQKGGGTKDFKQGVWNRYQAAVPTASGVNLLGRLDFQDIHNPECTLPATIGNTLLVTSGIRRLKYPIVSGIRKLTASTLMLERPSQVYGAPTIKVGIVATHMAHFRQSLGIKTVNETSDPSAFKGLQSILDGVVELPLGYSGAGDILTATHPDTRITTDPVRHFAFHEALGAPPDTIDTAKRSFSALVAHINLPYNLPEG